MKVKELKKILKNLDDEANVIISRDEEGNEFSVLCYASTNSIYDKDSGELYSDEWSAEAAGMTDDEWEETKKKRRSLVLYP